MASPRFWTRIGWFIGIWIASVAVLTVVAMLIRMVIG